MGAGYGMSTMTTDRTPEAQEGAGSLWGFISLGPPSSRVAAGSRTLLECLTRHPRASSGFPNNTPPTLTARAGGVRGPAKWALRRERNWGDLTTY